MLVWMPRHRVPKVHVTHRGNLLGQTDGVKRNSGVIVRTQQQGKINVALNGVVSLLAAAAAASIPTRAAQVGRARDV